MRKRDTGVSLLIVAAIGLALLFLRAAWADAVYGDWTCGFSECRRAK